eukprot:324941_1
MNTDTITSTDIDNILDEIDNQIDKVEQTKDSTQDALCEIYSRAQAKWLNGKIIKQFEFDKEQWLIVEYSNNTFQELKKDSKYIRFKTTAISSTTAHKITNSSTKTNNNTTNTNRKIKTATENKSIDSPDTVATKCNHIGCTCKEFKVPTSKWAKNKSKCQTCDHSKK